MGPWSAPAGRTASQRASSRTLAFVAPAGLIRGRAPVAWRRPRLTWRSVWEFMPHCEPAGPLRVRVIMIYHWPWRASYLVGAIANRAKSRGASGAAVWEGREWRYQAAARARASEPKATEAVECVDLFTIQ